MKKLAIICLGLLLLGGAAILAVGFMSLNSLIASSKPFLEKTASEALGTDVQLGALEASIFPSASVHVASLKIGPKERKEHLELKDLSLKIRLLPLLSKTLEIETILLKEPSITFIKDEKGTYIAGLPRKEKKNRAAEKGEAPPAAQESPAVEPAAPAVPLALTLQEFRIEDGLFILDDRTTGTMHQLEKANLTSSLRIDGEKVSLPAVDFSATVLHSLKVKLTAADAEVQGNDVRAPRITLSVGANTIDSSAIYNMKSQSGEVTVKSSNFDLGELTPALALAPQVKEMNPGGKLSFDLKAVLGPKNDYHSEGTISLHAVSVTHQAYRVTDLNGSIKSSASKEKALFSSEDLALALNGAPIKASFSGEFQPERQLELNPVKVSLFGGTTDLSLTLGLAAPKPLNSSFTLSGISLSQALAATGQPEEKQVFKATLEKVQGSVKGALADPAMLNTLTGPISMQLKDAEIKNFNLVGSVLNSIKDLPFMKGALIQAVPADQKGAIQSTDTVLSSITGNFQLSGGKISTSDFTALSALFSLDGAGTAAFDGTIDLTTTLRFTKEFSEALATTTKELRALFDAEGRLIIPLALKGKAPDIMVLPNIEKLLKTAGGKMLQDKASEFLGKALGGGKEKGSGKGLQDLLGF